MKKILLGLSIILLTAGSVFAQPLTKEVAIFQIVNATEKNKDWSVQKQAETVSEKEECSSFSLKKNLIFIITVKSPNKAIESVLFTLSGDSEIKDSKERIKVFVADEMNIIDTAVAIAGVSYKKNPELRQGLYKSIGPLNSVLADKPGTKSVAHLKGAGVDLAAMYTGQGMYVLQISASK